MSYCAIEEAFMPLVPGTATSKKSKKGRTIVVPPAPAGSDQETKEVSLAEGNDERDAYTGKDPDRPAQRPAPAMDVLSSSGSGSGANVRLESATTSTEFFPMQGSLAEPEAWQKAFMLGGATVPKPTFLVQDQPTLWRQIPKKVEVDVQPMNVEDLAPIRLQDPEGMNRRLDSLTRQLDALTTPTPMQNTAELFLFVAIGLLLLLAMDTLLRYATTLMNTGTVSGSLQVMAGGHTGGYRGRGYGGSRGGRR